MPDDYIKEIENANPNDLLKRIASDVAWIKTLLRGNGSPEKGWIVRFDRVEQFVSAAKWMFVVIITAIITLVINQVFGVV